MRKKHVVPLNQNEESFFAVHKEFGKGVPSVPSKKKRDLLRSWPLDSATAGGDTRAAAIVIRGQSGWASIQERISPVIIADTSAPRVDTNAVVNRS